MTQINKASDETKAKEEPAPEAPAKPTLHIDFPPVKEAGEVLGNQKAAHDPGEVRDDMEKDIPPVIRSVLELSHITMSGHSQWLRASPGYQGGMFHKGKPFCFASGYRDGTRVLDMEDKGNHMKLKDPLVYGNLTLPITAAYLCELHGKKIFDLEKPLVHYLPELHEKLDDGVTARSILSFTRVVEDKALLADAGARPWRAMMSPHICAAAQAHVYEPVTKFLAGCSTTSVTAQQQRANLVQYARTASRIPKFLHRPLHKGRISHTSVALLIAAVETQLDGRTFEESISELFFQRAQCHGSGFGAPKLWKDPNEIFYQPTGLALQHQGFRKPVPSGDVRNTGPAVWNSSLNLYAPSEDYGKLLLLSIDTILDARELLGCPTGVTKPYYDLGVVYLPSKDQLQLTTSALRCEEFIPSAASFRYSCEHDLGCFGIASCGSRGGRLFANNLSRMIHHLFAKHVLSKGLDATAPLDLDNPTKDSAGMETNISRATEKQKFTKYFKETEAHKRF